MDAMDPFADPDSLRLLEGSLRTTMAESLSASGQKLDAAVQVGKDEADDVAKAAKTSAKAAKDAVEDLIDDDTPGSGRGGA